MKTPIPERDFIKFMSAAPKWNALFNKRNFQIGLNLYDVQSGLNLYDDQSGLNLYDDQSGLIYMMTHHRTHLFKGAKNGQIREKRECRCGRERSFHFALLNIGSHPFPIRPHLMGQLGAQTFGHLTNSIYFNINF